MRKSIIITISIIISIICLACQKRTQDNSQKIWLHRANDIPKAQYFQDKYAGLEIDITYLDSLNTFIVFHGGDLDDTGSFTLEQWLNEIENVNELGLWLDFKNLNCDNRKPALDELNRLCSKFKIKKSKIIIENWNAQDFPIFQEDGYKTSYYIPDFNPKKTSKDDIQKHTYKIREIISAYHPTTISGYYYQYQFMRDSFPDTDVMIWYTKGRKRVLKKYIDFVNQDDKAKVLLIADEVPSDVKYFNYCRYDE